MSTRARHLESWLEYMSRVRQSSRSNRALWKLIGAGLISVSLGASLARDDYEEDRSSSLPVPLTAGIVGALLADGIVALSLESNEELRYQRWRSLPRKDELIIARFEGELAAAATESRRGAMYGGALSVGVAAAGAALLVVTPFRDGETSTQFVAYAAGGVDPILSTRVGSSEWVEVIRGRADARGV